MRRCAFLGGHPMAGKELRGAAAADADLFRGRPWVLTSDLDHPDFENGWLRLARAKSFSMPREHDRLVAWSSHLPQLASTALASVLGDRAPEAANVAGPGLLDSTRLAMSSFDLWRDILETNQRRGLVGAGCLYRKADSARSDFEGEFRKGGEFARSLRDARP